MKILMVCIGNICRSPIAEGVMRHFAKAKHLDWEIESAGTSNYHIGEPPHPFSRKICLANGISIEHQRASQFKSSDFNYYDKIFAMSEDVLEDLMQLATTPIHSQKLGLLLDELPDFHLRSVPDPWYGDESGYQPVFNMIHAACQEFVLKNS